MTRARLDAALKAERVVTSAAAQGIEVAAIRTTDDAASRIVRVVNQSGEDLEMLVTRTQEESAKRNVWMPIAPGEAKIINSTSPWESVMLRNTLGRRASAHVPRGTEITITKPLPAQFYVPESFYVTPITDTAKPKNAIIVENSKEIWQWHRDESAMLLVHDGYSMRDAVLVKPGSNVHFIGPEPLALAALHGPGKPMIIVTNTTAVEIEVQVSIGSTGADKWCTLPPGQSGSWVRPGQDWEAVLVRRDDHCRGHLVPAFDVPVPVSSSLSSASKEGRVQFENTTKDSVDVMVTALDSIKPNDAAAACSAESAKWITVSPGDKVDWSHCGVQILAVRR
ncbi:hypothetical protein GGF32_007887 [Allomyces javanicus]|nr:hypothetical protein GGF32_007887 [Allomyces javanicus]